MLHFVLGAQRRLGRQSQQQIAATFEQLRQQASLPQRDQIQIMPGIMKRAGRNRRRRVGLTGPLARRCHTFRRDGYVNEPHLDVEGYEKDRDERRALWLELCEEKEGNRADKSLDKAIFRNLGLFTCEVPENSTREAEVFPYIYLEKTFEITVSNIALMKIYRDARESLTGVDKIVIRRRASQR